MGIVKISIKSPCDKSEFFTRSEYCNYIGIIPSIVLTKAYVVNYSKFIKKFIDLICTYVPDHTCFPNLAPPDVVLCIQSNESILKRFSMFLVFTHFEHGAEETGKLLNRIKYFFTRSYKIKELLPQVLTNRCTSLKTYLKKLKEDIEIYITNLVVNFDKKFVKYRASTYTMINEVAEKALLELHMYDYEISKAIEPFLKLATWIKVDKDEKLNIYIWHTVYSDDDRINKILKTGTLLKLKQLKTK